MSSLSCAQLCRRFTLDEILSATKNFDDALVVGEGGFGKVYKANISVENGEDFFVAIKRLKFNSSQGATEFWAEIEMLTKLRHCNLVSLIGYCNDNSEMILIYEFMPLGTLCDHLRRHGTSMSWVQRLKISIGATRGLHYLHTGIGTQHGIIHRDVKSTNILLDEDYAAKISDFGLSKISPTNASGSYVNTVVRGTFGYLDPEYFLTGRLTRKSDVFAFGVVLFELLCGRVAVDKNLDEDKCSLAKWAHESIEKGKVYEIIDFNIKSQISPKCLKIYVQIADRCLSSESKKRPTMAEIVVALEHCLTVQNKFDNRVKPGAGILSIGKMIKWPFISLEVNSAQGNRKPSTINEDTIEHSSSSKEVTIDHGEVVPLGGMLDHSDHVAVAEGHVLMKFSFDDLQNATRGFNDDTRLGGGRYGDVFEGWMDTNTSSLPLPDGLLRIAIKRFRQNRIQHHLTDTLLDMTFLRELDHPNLTKVLGYCLEDKRLYLVYEFMENGSLDSHLFRKDKIPLSWKTRVRIATGIAEALSFLHRTQDQAYYFSIDSHQILLDKNFKAKISYVESAKLVDGDSYKLKNTDPLYYYPISDKPKFEGINRSFGIVLVQILTAHCDGEFAFFKIEQSVTNQIGREESKKRLRRALDPRLPNVDDNIIKGAITLAKLAIHSFRDPNFFTHEEPLKVLRKLYNDVI